jgi:probable pyridine nucleotide-disulfide oxidoreductase
MEQFDLIVIGNGSAGDNIARTLGRKGVRVAVVERQHLGGECLNDGCVPSKALIDISRRASRDGLGWDQVVARIHATQLLVRGNDPNGGMRADGIELFWGDAHFLTANVLDVDGRELTAPHIVVATGTAPALPPIPGLEDARPQTNRTIFHLPSLPGRLAVLGGGPIGLELGQSLRRLGCEVTILEVADRIATTEDHEVSLELTRALELEGVRVVTGITIEQVKRSDGCVTFTTDRGCFEFEDILVAAGRKPQIPAGLTELGLELDARGFAAISPCGKTNLPGVWAAGDITGKFLFTHYASYQAHHIGRHLLDDSCVPIPDTLVPWAIFTEPEVGHAGMTEVQARASGANVRVVVLEAAELDWFRTVGRTDGFAKVIADADTGVLLGAHFVCARGSTLVGEACLAIQHGLTARDVASTVHPYPTASELFRWACARLV